VTADRNLSDDAREADPSEWSSRALTRRLADYLVNAYTDGRGYDPADLDDVEVTLRDGFDIVLGEMHEAQRDRSDGGGSEDSTTASEYPATAEPPPAPVTASGEAEAEAARLRAEVATARRVLRLMLAGDLNVGADDDGAFFAEQWTEGIDVGGWASMREDDPEGFALLARLNQFDALAAEAQP
jgi:hypothetical protein